MQQIGLYVHRLRVFENNERWELGNEVGQFDLRGLIDAFVEHYSLNAIEGTERRSLLESRSHDQDFVSGIIKYGSTGIASDIVNPQTGALELHRELDFVEEIPLYFCFFTPNGEDTWYVATQSFGGRSCSGSFNKAFYDFFRLSFNQILTVQKVVPVDGDEVDNAPVRQITLIRKAVDASEVRQQLNNLAHEVEMRLSISIDGRGALGRFRTIQDYFTGNSAIALVYNGIEFEEAQATVRIGKTYRKVGVIGASNSAGVVDISDEVDRDIDQHPLFDSIDALTRDLCQDYLDEYRGQ